MEITGVETITFEHPAPYSADEEAHGHPGEPTPAESHLTHIEVAGGPDGYYDGGSAAFNRKAAGILEGENPLRREYLWERLVRSQPRSGEGRGALAAVDCALHDVAGKDAGQPVWQLLGGCRDTVPCYASTMAGDDGPEGLGPSMRTLILPRS